MRPRFCLFLIIIALPRANQVFGQQNFGISGIIYFADSLPAVNSMVVLVKAAGNDIVKSAFADSAGSYAFTGLQKDTFKLLVSAPGYADYESDLIITGNGNAEIRVSDIRLFDNTEQLPEVAVTASIPFAERRSDRIIINPSALISSAGSNALELLARSPGVLVDASESIRLKGKPGVVIFIDDKPTYLSGEELINYLKTISANDIRQIEIMVNPPARYDAAGNAGIINIITRKSRIKGYNGAASLSYGQGRYSRTSDNFSINFANSKFAFYSGASVAAQGFYQDLKISRKYKDENQVPQTYFNQETFIKVVSQSYSARLGLDYYISRKTTFGINAKGALSPVRSCTDNKAVVLNGQQELLNNVFASNNEKNIAKSGVLNLNLSHQLDTLGQKITADLDYVVYAGNAEQVFTNSVFLPGDSAVYSDTQNGNLPSLITIYAFKSDYEKPMKHNDKLDAGIKTSYIKTDNKATYTITQNDVTQNNYDLSNHFKYDELINAAYINYARSFTWIDLQGGLRFESTLLNGYQKGNVIKPASEFKRAYHNLFPTFYALFRLDSASNHLVTLSYGRRINRPFYKDLNPFVRPLDKYTFYSGNPYLQPSFAHNASLAYSFSSYFTSTLSYGYSVNDIRETIEIKEGIYYSRPGNIGKNHFLNFSVETTIHVAKWLNTTLYSELVYAKYISGLYTQQLNRQGIYVAANAVNSFVLGSNWSAELSGEYITGFIDAQFSFRAFGFITLGVQKKIMKEKGSLKFSLSDLLYTNRIYGTITTLENADAGWKSRTDSRIASLTFSYRFGSGENIKPRRTASGSDTEQSRIKK